MYYPPQSEPCKSFKFNNFQHCCQKRASDSTTEQNRRLRDMLSNHAMEIGRFRLYALSKNIIRKSIHILLGWGLHNSTQDCATIQISLRVAVVACHSPRLSCVVWCSSFDTSNHDRTSSRIIFSAAEECLTLRQTDWAITRYCPVDHKLSNAQELSIAIKVK